MEKNKSYFIFNDSVRCAFCKWVTIAVSQIGRTPTEQAVRVDLGELCSASEPSDRASGP
ncbi:hypothetical protein M434DRAFT_29251 [Hypoxylon sp. CO27-5]|nr:hypothetical protein M434DRAFT_29251 [Hypoxylon sp. CO27-5]